MKTTNPLTLTTSPLSQPARKPRRTVTLTHRQRSLYGRKRHYSTVKERDTETGLYYYGARYLDGKTSRWLSGDPAVGEYVPSAPVDDGARKRNKNLPGQGGVFNYVNLHVYHYAGNNPVKYTDPDGREDEPPSTFKVPRDFYEQFTKDSMKDYWAEGTPGGKEGQSFCNKFLPSLARKLGDKVFKDIFPKGEIKASELYDSFQNNVNLQEIGANGSNEKRAVAAQDLANSGYLVLAALEGGSHVAAVGPQSLNYGSYPTVKWEGHGADPYQSGNGYGGAALRQFPVFVQAGSYTGVVNPGNAMTRPALDDNKVHYFIYKPR